jgi:hypothetical protein
MSNGGMKRTTLFFLPRCSHPHPTKTSVALYIKMKRQETSSLLLRFQVIMFHQLENILRLEPSSLVLYCVDRDKVVKELMCNRVIKIENCYTKIMIVKLKYN